MHHVLFEAISILSSDDNICRQRCVLLLCVTRVQRHLIAILVHAKLNYISQHRGRIIWWNGRVARFKGKKSRYWG